MAAGYGVETWCAGYRVTGRLDRGPGLVARAIYRRLITPRGTLRGGDEEAAYGFDVSGYVGAVGYETALAALPGLVRGECLKDDRISSVNVTATQRTDAAGLIAIELSIDAELIEEGEAFALTLGVNEIDAKILGLSFAALPEVS